MSSQQTMDADTLHAHAVMARNALERLNAEAERAASTAGLEPGAAVPAPQAQYNYTSVVALGGVLYVKVDMTFPEVSSNVSFDGHSGGLAAIAGVSAGKFWSNYSLEELKGSEARFEGQFAASAVNVNFWHMDGRVIGTFVGGGLSVGAGVIGGQGSF